MKYYEKYSRYSQYPDFSVFRAEILNDDLKTWHIGIPIGSHPVDAEVVLKEESIINKGFKIINTMEFMKCKKKRYLMRSGKIKEKRRLTHKAVDILPSPQLLVLVLVLSLPPDHFRFSKLCCSFFVFWGTFLTFKS